MVSKAGVKSTTLALVGLLWNHSPALAAPNDARNHAAELFEQGVRQFSSAQYEPSAKAFMAADELAPNTRALVNAITAARRAGLHLLMARAAERALARDLDPATAAFAREALAEAAQNLTRVEVSCSVPNCRVIVDDAAVTPGKLLYLLPGTHEFLGAAPNDALATEHLATVPGASYRVILTPKTAAPERPPELARSERGELSPAEPLQTQSKPFAPAVFYAGAAGTAVLVGLTTWSGFDTLSAKSAATEATWGHVKNLALRTDLLLAGAAILGGATAAAGIWLVDWGSDTHAAAALLPSGGAAVMAQGRF
jgi:hypothetical protein